MNTITRLSAAAAALAIAGGGAAGIAVASTGNAAAAGNGTFTVLAHTVRQAGPTHPAFGDQITFVDRLSRHGNTVGHDAVHCTMVGPIRVLCVAGFVFRNGQLTGSGIVRPTQRQFNFPLTGGTGAYIGANGYLHIRQLNQTDAILTFHVRH